PVSAWGRRSFFVVCPVGSTTRADHRRRWSAPRFLGHAADIWLPALPPALHHPPAHPTPSATTSPAPPDTTSPPPAASAASPCRWHTPARPPTPARSPPRSTPTPI